MSGTSRVLTRAAYNSSSSLEIRTLSPSVRSSLASTQFGGAENRIRTQIHQLLYVIKYKNRMLMARCIPPLINIEPSTYCCLPGGFLECEEELPSSSSSEKLLSSPRWKPSSAAKLSSRRLTARPLDCNPHHINHETCNARQDQAH